MKTTWIPIVGAICVVAGAAIAQTERMVDTALSSDILTLRLPVTTDAAATTSAQAPNTSSNQALEQELVQEAARRGLPERVDVQERLRRSRWQILITSLREDVVRGLPAPREDEIRRSFEQEKARWRLPEAYRIDAFVVPASNAEAASKMKAMVAAKRLDEKALEAMSAQRIANSAKESWLSRDNFHPEIWAILPVMGIDELRTLAVDQERVLVRKAAVRAERAMTLDEAREPIRMYLQTGKADAAWNAFLKRKMSELGLKE